MNRTELLVAPSQRSRSSLKCVGSFSLNLNHVYTKCIYVKISVSQWNARIHFSDDFKKTLQHFFYFTFVNPKDFDRYAIFKNFL